MFALIILDVVSALHRGSSNTSGEELCMIMSGPPLYMKQEADCKLPSEHLKTTTTVAKTKCKCVKYDQHNAVKSKDTTNCPASYSDIQVLCHSSSFRSAKVPDFTLT